MTRTGALFLLDGLSQRNVQDFANLLRRLLNQETQCIITTPGLGSYDVHLGNGRCQCLGDDLRGNCSVVRKAARLV